MIDVIVVFFCTLLIVVYTDFRIFQINEKISNKSTKFIENQFLGIVINPEELLCIVRNKHELTCWFKNGTFTTCKAPCDSTQHLAKREDEIEKLFRQLSQLNPKSNSK